MADIFLDGGETAIVKAIGLSGSVVNGEMILDRAKSMDIREVIDVIQCLMSTGYVICDHDTFKDSDAFRKAEFHINSGYSKELKQALDPEPDSKKPRRIRRE